MLLVERFLLLSLELIQSIEHIACTVVRHLEHQIGAQLWKYWIVGQQSIHCAAVTTQVYLRLHCKDCQFWLCACWLCALKTRLQDVCKNSEQAILNQKILKNFLCQQHFHYFRSRIKNLLQDELFKKFRFCLFVRLWYTNLIKRIEESLFLCTIQRRTRRNHNEKREFFEMRKTDKIKFRTPPGSV